MERQRERLEPFTHRIEEATSVALMLEARRQIIVYRTTIMSPRASCRRQRSAHRS